MQRSHRPEQRQRLEPVPDELGGFVSSAEVVDQGASQGEVGTPRRRELDDAHPVEGATSYRRRVLVPTLGLGDERRGPVEVPGADRSAGAAYGQSQGGELV